MGCETAIFVLFVSQQLPINESATFFIILYKDIHCLCPVNLPKNDH